MRKEAMIFMAAQDSAGGGKAQVGSEGREGGVGIPARWAGTPGNSAPSQVAII
jgi:hypothetical protein